MIGASSPSSIVSGNIVILIRSALACCIRLLTACVPVGQRTCIYIYSQTEWQYTQWGTIMHNSTVHNGVYTHHTLLRAETTATRFFTLHTCCVLVKCTCIVHVWTIICVQTKEIMVKQMFGAKSVPHDKVGTSSNTHYVCTSYSSEIANENTSKAVNNDSQGYS